MTSAVWTLAFAACMLIAPPGQAAAQDTIPAPRNGAADSIRSSKSGVFTAAQATRGEETFTGLCQSCHGAEQHATPAFQGTWGGKPLSELFMYMVAQMPKDNPGALAPGEYAQVLAYLLKLNGMPAGEVELPSDSLALKLIRFDTTTVDTTTKAQPAKSGKR